ncbi:MAG: tetratricopeptide repeat protein [Sedimentisphaerales bacterium]|jgi:tetratricopeptide (TPR) repeat protein
MGQLLGILGSGIEVEITDLIWHCLRQSAESIAKSDPAHAQMLEGLVGLANARKPSVLKRCLDEYRSAHPRSHYASLAAAAIALADSRLNDAFGRLNSVYSKCPRNITALYALGHCCERLGREADAIAFYQDCLKFKNHLRFPRQRLAAIYFKNGQIEKTIAEYRQLAAEYPDDLSILLTLAHLYIAVSQYELASDTFSNAILIQPDNFSPENDEIDSLIEAGDPNSAIDLIEATLEQYPDRPDLLLRRASVLASLGQDDQALEYYNHTVAVCPHFLDANIRLGSHYMRLGKPASAAIQFMQAALVNDHLVDAYLGLAAAQKFSNKTSEALVSLSLASTIDTNGPILFAQAACLQCHLPSADIKLHPIDSILDAQRNMLQLRPQNPELHYRLGVLLMSIGRITQAAELFQRALQLNPTFAAARNKLAVCLYETDETALALETLTPPNCLQADTLDLHYRVALLYCDKIKFASSLLDLEQWLHETLASADAVVNISIVLQNLGLLDPACSTWDNLVPLASCQTE